MYFLQPNSWWFLFSSRPFIFSEEPRLWNCSLNSFVFPEVIGTLCNAFVRSVGRSEALILSSAWCLHKNITITLQLIIITLTLLKQWSHNIYRYLCVRFKWLRYPCILENNNEIQCILENNNEIQCILENNNEIQCILENNNEIQCILENNNEIQCILENNNEIQLLVFYVCSEQGYYSSLAL